MAEEKIKKSGGKQSRIGGRFHDEITVIQDKRLLSGKSKDRVSVEKITNLIVRHKDWKKISENIINADEEEVEKYGK